MLCPSTPAAPRLARAFAQAARSVAGAYTLSISEYQRPPLTPLPSADTMRLRPHRGFRPGPVPGVCTTFSLTGTAGASLLRCGRHTSTFLPPFPRPGFATRASRDGCRCGTMRALTPAGLADTDRSLRLPRFAFRTSRPQPRPAPERRLLCRLSASGRCSCERQASPWDCRLAATGRRIGFVLLQAVRSPPVAPTPPRGDAVTFDFMRCDFHMARTPTLLTKRPRGRTIPGLEAGDSNRSCRLRPRSAPQLAPIVLQFVGHQLKADVHAVVRGQLTHLQRDFLRQRLLE